MPTVSTGSAGGVLTPSKKCGETFCPVYHVCLERDFRCYACQPYCNETSHNFDERICAKDCQDYIHDFGKHYVQYDEIKNTLAKVESIQTGVISIAIMVLITLIFVTVALTFMWRLDKKIRRINNGGRDLTCKNKLDSFQCVENTDPAKTVSETSLAAERTDPRDVVATASVSSASSEQSRTNTTSPSSGENSTNGSSCCSCCSTVSELSSGYGNYRYALEDSPVMSSKTASSPGSGIARLSPPVDRCRSV